MKYVINLNEWGESAVLGQSSGGFRNICLFAIAERLERIAELMEVTQPSNEPEGCQDRTCGYYSHYLAYGSAELTHEGYHAAEQLCLNHQERVSEHLARCQLCNEGLKCPTHESLSKVANEWELRVRA